MIDLERLSLLKGEAAFTTSTSVGIGVGVIITDTSTGEVIFTSVNHGFDVNAVQTTTYPHVRRWTDVCGDSILHARSDALAPLTPVYGTCIGPVRSMQVPR